MMTLQDHPLLQQLSIGKPPLTPPFRLISSSPLSGGCLNDVQLTDLEDSAGTSLQLVFKHDPKQTGQLQTEAWMLNYLAQHSPIPVPKVYGAADDLLIMQACPSDGSLNNLAQENLAQQVAQLHQVRGESYGLERDTTIGLLPQPNPPTSSWLNFFRDHRLRHMANLALDEGKLDGKTHQRLLTLCDQLKKWLMEPAYPALLHGDLWHGNILIHDNKLSALIDPAIYYGHPEIELAFMTLFDSVSEPFFKAYQAINPIEDGFFEVRKDLYNLYPLLVHVRLFGSSYVGAIQSTLNRIGL